MLTNWRLKRFFTTVLIALLLPLFGNTIVAAQKQLGEPTIVHFETASAILNTQNIAKLKRLATEIKQVQVRMILVEGYCDRRRIVDDHIYKSNQQLSQARAYNVANLLQSETGLPANRFTRYGYGASKMVAGSDSKEGLAANRRVEIRVFLQN